MGCRVGRGHGVWHPGPRRTRAVGGGARRSSWQRATAGLCDARTSAGWDDATGDVSHCTVWRTPDAAADVELPVRGDCGGWRVSVRVLARVRVEAAGRQPELTWGDATRQQAREAALSSASCWAEVTWTW